MNAAEIKHLGQTAISRRGPSAPAKLLDKQGRLEGRMLDFGSGRGADAEHFEMLSYDPYWDPIWPDIWWGFDTITCVYVLNIVTPEIQEEIIDDVVSMLAPEGRAYFAVRRDIPKTGRPGKNCYQRWVELDAPLIALSRNFAIYEKRSGEIPDANTNRDKETENDKN